MMEKLFTDVKRIFRRIRRFFKRTMSMIMDDKITRRNAIAVAALVLILLVSGVVYLIVESNNTLHSADEMVRVVKKENDLAGEMEAIDTMIVDDVMLLLCQGEDGICYAAEFNIISDGSYKFLRLLQVNEIESQIYYANWFDKMVVICDNEDAIRYEADMDGEVENGEITEMPSVLTFEYINSCSVDFYDVEGNLIR